MKAGNVLSYIGHIVSKFEPEYTIRLEDIIFSKSHGHEICVMQLVGKSAFPKYTAEQLLSDPKALIGLSPQDAVTIAQLDHKIKERMKKSQVLEVDRNGTILLRDSKGNEIRYSEKYLSSERELIKGMQSDDAHDLGYRVGFREGLSIKKTLKASANIKSKLLQIISFNKKI